METEVMLLFSILSAFVFGLFICEIWNKKISLYETSKIICLIIPTIMSCLIIMYTIFTKDSRYGAICQHFATIPLEIPVTLSICLIDKPIFLNSCNFLSLSSLINFIKLFGSIPSNSFFTMSYITLFHQYFYIYFLNLHY